MDKSREIRVGKHCIFLMHVHLIFVTKYRKTIFSKVVIEDIKILFEKVCIHFEAELIEFDAEGNHVHLLVNYPPKISV
jgi:putative transposase